eukprot:1012376-Karenia_brevis.AAC.1
MCFCLRASTTKAGIVPSAHTHSSRSTIRLDSWPGHACDAASPRLPRCAEAPLLRNTASHTHIDTCIQLPFGPSRHRALDCWAI